MFCENKIMLQNANLGEMVVDVDSGLSTDETFCIQSCVDPDQRYKLMFIETYGNWVLKRTYSNLL